jgi:hypothetical protein
MFLEELFASIREYGNRRTQRSADKEEASITRRLHELLDLEKSIQAERPLPKTHTLRQDPSLRP